MLACKDSSNDIRWHPGERLHHLFEDRCDRFSEAGDDGHSAVDSVEGAWSYRELDDRANQLARYLKVQGLGAGDIVGLLFDRGVHSYISMLAVLKIHAAYVPLDPAFPEDRIAFIVRDAGLNSILTLSRHLLLARSVCSSVICVDRESARIDLQAPVRPGEEITGRPVSELCYIIYTSGSTGRPKGVPIEHGGICNFVRVAAEVYGYRSADRVYQGLTIAFDFAVEEIWVPLAVGATLVPGHTGGSLLGSELSVFLRAGKVTAMCCVPTLLATIDEELPDLRLLILSGESCPGNLVARWHSPQRTILNAYGPTEATVTATLARLKPEEPVTIGTPLPTYSVLILEPGTEAEVPRGETGEIAIAGIGVARGYLNREDQTRKAFIKDFLNIPNNPSGLIYRTGDLGRINEAGDLEYRGRIDTQVKIRGYRIELTEIESVILQVPRIAQAVVDTFEPVPGVKELVAYCTLKAGSSRLLQEDLVDVLRSMLPNYMVPAFYEILPAMPVMASGKIDRGALPEPSGVRMNAGERRAFAEPRGKVEKDIARVLASLLRLDAVSAEDDFFEDLGANSLLMAQFGARLRRELGIADFSMRDMYAFPSVRKLSASMCSDGHGRTPVIRDNPGHKATNPQYALSGAAQLGVIFAGVFFYVSLFREGSAWIAEAPGSLNAYVRALLFSTAAFALSVLMPVGMKWLLVGRWKAEEFPVWSLRYLRFWTVKTLVRYNPMAFLAGSPLYNGYLKLLGARVSWKSLILTRHFPVCTDLFSSGEGAVVSKRAILPGYRAESGRVRTGGVVLERDTFVGEAAVLDIDTVMKEGSELAHASSLQRGQKLAADRYYHGSPAQRTEHRYRALQNGTAGAGRMVLYSMAQLALIFLVLGPLAMMIAVNFPDVGHGDAAGIVGLPPSTRPLAHIMDIAVRASLVYAAFLAAGLAFIALIPRFLNLFLREGRIYPLYGVHYMIHRMVEAFSNSAFYNILFGDSSYIVYFLRAVGYRYRDLVQTGSNFGLSQQHNNPFLCEFGKGFMVSDGFTLVNAEYSAKSFTLSRARVGGRSFIGNNVLYPARGRAGENCLLGTKVMVPVHGPVREHTGLLGSPSFEIPRSVRRDCRFDSFKRKEQLHERLGKKNASNIRTMCFYLLSDLAILVVIVAGWSYPPFQPMEHKALGYTGLFIGTQAVLIVYYMLVDRASLSFRSLKPEYCSIYDEYYWRHERFWKLGLHSRTVVRGAWVLLNGTPFKGPAWRMLGVKVGKKLFDDGTYIPEKSMVSIGDYCTLNDFSVLQCHSLEDGTFKSDYSSIGNECTIGVNSFVHYGVVMQNDVALDPDSFLMKGERPDAGSIWQGNPAREMLSGHPAEREED